MGISVFGLMVLAGIALAVVAAIVICVVLAFGQKR